METNAVAGNGELGRVVSSREPRRRQGGRGKSVLSFPPSQGRVTVVLL